MSLDDLARASGVSRAALSQVETCKTDPTVGLLWKIAVGLGVPFADLIGEPKGGTSVLRRGDAQCSVRSTESSRAVRSQPPARLRSWSSTSSVCPTLDALRPSPRAGNARISRGALGLFSSSRRRRSPRPCRRRHDLVLGRPAPSLRKPRRPPRRAVTTSFSTSAERRHRNRELRACEVGIRRSRSRVRPSRFRRSLAPPNARQPGSCRTP